MSRFIVDTFLAPRERNSLRIAYWLQHDSDLADALKNDAMKQELLAQLRPMSEAPLDSTIWVLPKQSDRFFLVSGTKELNGSWSVDGILWKLSVGQGWYETGDLRGFTLLSAY